MFARFAASAMLMHIQKLSATIGANGQSVKARAAIKENAKETAAKKQRFQLITGRIGNTIKTENFSATEQKQEFAPIVPQPKLKKLIIHHGFAKYFIQSLCLSAILSINSFIWFHLIGFSLT